MNKYGKERISLLIAMLLAFSAIAIASPVRENVWVQVDKEQLRLVGREASLPADFGAFRLDRAALQAILSTAPEEFTDAPEAILSLPMPDGTFRRFRIYHSLVVEQGLVDKYPELGQTYIGQGIDDPTATVRFDFFPTGFHGMVLSTRGTVMIDPFTAGDTETYISYFKRDMPRIDEFTCLVGQPGFDDLLKPLDPDKLPFLQNESQPEVISGTQLRTYRLAVAATWEYCDVQPGENTLTVCLAGQVTVINRVNQLFERDVAIRMIIIAGNGQIVFASNNSTCGPGQNEICSSANDPYTNNNGNVMLGENQSTIDSRLGSSAYDIGHVFSTGGGGIAQLNSPCVTGNKARGVTGSPAPFGDPFAVDYVAHEIGHQFGGNHTFNASGPGSSAGNRVAAAAYEPGSGVTIMGYAGICGNQSLAAHSIDTFHVKSIEEIVAFSTTGAGNSCAVTTATGNTPPTVTDAGNFTIPKLTPFALSASANDPNGDSITYDWQEYDLGPATTAVPNTDNPDAMPIFRPYSPTTSGRRSYPSLDYILFNANVPPPTNLGFLNGELLPQIGGRVMTFQVIARDNRAGGGGVNTASSTLSVASNSGPFQVTFPNTEIAVPGGQPMTVQWNVNNTTAPPVSEANVRIRLSTDLGQTFPTILASSTANDGSETVTIPNTPTIAARIKIEAVNSVFFDISNTSFVITAGATPTPTPPPATPTPPAATPTPSPSACYPQPSGMVSWWQAEGNALDALGVNHGSAEGGVTYQPGMVGQAFNLNGTNQRILIGNPANMQLQDLTIDMWVQRGSATVVSNNPAGPLQLAGLLAYGTNGYGLGIKPDGTILLTKVGVSGTDSLGTKIMDTALHHVAVTKSGGNVTFYVDGVPSAGSAGNYDPGFEFSSSAYIGYFGSGGGEFLGKIDETAIYNRALTGSEIAGIFGAGTFGICPAATPTPTPGTTFNVVNEFSLTPQTDTSTWQYGSTSGPDSDFFTRLPNANLRAACSAAPGTDFAVWETPVSNGAHIGHNVSGATFFCGSLRVPTDRVYMHPGEGGQRSVVRWRAPVSGTFRFAGLFEGLNPPGVTDIKILSSVSGVLFSGANSGTAQLPFDVTATVEAGNTIDLSLGWGNGTWNSDGTGLALTVDLLSAATPTPTPTPTACYPAPSGMVSWWKGDGTANDSAGANNGTLQNGATYAAGLIGQAFSFNGANQYMLVGDPVPASLQIQNEITLESWIYVTSYPNPGTTELAVIIGSQRDDTTSGATIMLDGRTNPDGQTAPPGHIHFQIGDGSWHVTNANSAVPLNQWVHVVATRKANEDGKIYYNGVLQPSTSAPWTGTISYNGAWFAIGQQKDRNRPFNGLIDEAAIYNRALTATEVAGIHAASSSGICPIVTATPTPTPTPTPSPNGTPPTAAGVLNGTISSGQTLTGVSVTYTDDIAIDVSTIDNSDIRVTGPNGFDAAGAFTGINNNTNGTPRIATYLLGSPGGSWDIGDNGTYNIVMQGGEVRDTSGLSVPAGVIGTFVVDLTPPNAAPTGTATSPNAVAGQTAQAISATYTDDVAINASTIGTGDLLITGPNGFQAAAAFVGQSPPNNSPQHQAVYSFTPPGGTWDFGDNGTYNFVMRPNEVADTGGLFVAEGTIGTLVVNIAQPTPTPTPGPTQLYTRGDYDGDNKTDLTVWRPTMFPPNLSAYFTFRSTTGSFLGIQFGNTGDVAIAGDFDGDNKSDFGVSRFNNADTVDLIYVESSTNTAKFPVWGNTGDIFISGDYDGDKKTDVMAWRPSDGTWYIVNSSGANGGFTFIQHGQSLDKPYAMDTDGDGKSNLVYFRPSSGDWVVRNNDGSTTTTNFGLSSDIPVPADYDGDNKDDIAVFRDGLWIVLKSSNGQVEFMPFGAAGDIPVPGDYDGDNLYDRAVYREGIWHMLRSSQGYTGFQFGASTDTPMPKAYIP